MSDAVPSSHTVLVRLSSALVSAYVCNNAMPRAALPDLIASVHAAIGTLMASAPTNIPDLVKPSPAEVKRSITPDALPSFHDGRAYKTLKRHLGSHGLTPADYRARFGLPMDYPMVAARYAAERSALAKGMGLGILRKRAALSPL